MLTALLPDGRETDCVNVVGVADTGAQSNVWGMGDFQKSGLPQYLLQKVTLNFLGVNQSRLEIVGGFRAKCTGNAPNGDVIACELYISSNIFGFYMSYDTMLDLLIINRDFPTIHGGDQKTRWYTAPNC